jgi:hypothetical protein
MDWQKTVVVPVEDVGSRVLTFLPTIVSVVLILVVGWMLASLFQKVITRFCKLARLDSVSEKIGIANILTKGDINYTLSEIIGVLIYWLGMLIVILMAVNALRLEVAAQLLNQIILYIPNVILSVFILVLGIFFASVCANTVRTAAANAGVLQSRSLGQFTQVMIVIFTVVEALKQLRVDTTMIDLLVKAVLFAIALGVGLAIGLGCKEIANKHVSQLIDSFKPRK